VIAVLAVVVVVIAIYRKKVRIQCPDVVQMVRGLNDLTVRNAQPVAAVDDKEGLQTDRATPHVSELRDANQQGPRVIQCICTIPKKVCLITFMVITLTLGLSFGLVIVVDWGLAAYCDTSVSVYTFPLGHSITSHGLGQLEAIHMSSFLNRCKRQNEFTVPGTVRFNKAIKCVRTTNYHKKGNSGKHSRRDNDGSSDSISGHLGASGSLVGITASAEASFSKTDAVETMVQKTVSTSNNVAISLTTYHCEVGSVMVSSYTPSSALKKDMDTLNKDPHSNIDEFLREWGYAFVSSITVGGYYSSFNIFSTCNKDAIEGLDSATELCNELAVKTEVTGGTFGASGGFSKVKCNTEGLSESQREILTKIDKESQKLQVGGDTLGGETDWETTLKMNPYPLKMKITPITEIDGFSKDAVTLIKRRAKSVQLSVASLMEKVPDLTRRC
jgi:hypothetical protein